MELSCGPMRDRCSGRWGRQGAGGRPAPLRSFVSSALSVQSKLCSTSTIYLHRREQLLVPSPREQGFLSPLSLSVQSISILASPGPHPQLTAAITHRAVELVARRSLRFGNSFVSWGSECLLAVQDWGGGDSEGPHLECSLSSSHDTGPLRLLTVTSN